MNSSFNPQSISLYACLNVCSQRKMMKIMRKIKIYEEKSIVWNDYYSMKTKRRRDVKRRVKFMMIKTKICSHKAIIKKKWRTLYSWWWDFFLLLRGNFNNQFYYWINLFPIILHFTSVSPKKKMIVTSRIHSFITINYNWKRNQINTEQRIKNAKKIS